MASSNSIFNWRTRYRVLAADMNNFQSMLLGNPDAMAEGLLNGSVLSGFEAATGGAMSISIAPGIAEGPTGYLHTINSISTVTPTAPTGSFPARNLIVVRPQLTNTDPMTNPTNPFETVYLRTVLGSQVMLLPGTAASAPQYPAVEPNDVVLAGVRTYPGQTVIALEDIDFTQRWSVGKKSALLQDAASFDDRLRPFIVSNQVLGIRPSQYGGGGQAKQFKASANNRGSIFPKTPAGNYNYNDTFMNFQTGAVTGGDGATGSFTPSIPSAGNSIVATVVLTQNNTLSVSYGTAGTRAQCFAGISNQTASGAGSVAIPTTGQPIAFVLVTSSNGTTVTEIDFYDARGIIQGGGGASGSEFNFLTNGNFEQSIPGTVPTDWSTYIETQPIVFNDSLDRCSQDLGTAFTLNNGDQVSFTVINTTTGISVNTIYYVINSVALNFQLSLTLGGSAIALTNDGTGTMVRAKPKGFPSGTPNITFLTTSTNPLDGTISANLAKPASNCMGQGVARRFTVPLGWRQQRMTTVLCLINANVANFVAGDISFYLYDEDNQTLISPSVVPIPKANGGWFINFMSTTAANYRLLIHIATPNTSAYTVGFDDFVITPLTQALPTGGLTNFQSYLPSFGAGLGTVTAPNLSWRTEGECYRIFGRITLGTTTSGVAQVTIPNGQLAAAPAQLNAALTYKGGIYSRENASSSTVKRGVIMYVPGNNYFSFGYDEYSQAVAPGTALNGLQLGSSGEAIWIDALIPIASLAGQALLAGPGANEEYLASTNSTWDAAAGSANTVYGPAGAPIAGTLTANRDKVCRLQTPLQATDRLQIQYQLPSGGGWIDQDQSVIPYVNWPSVQYGAFIQSAVIGSFDVTVRFMQYQAPGSTYNTNPGTNWSASSYINWRLVRYRSSAPVGFGIADLAGNPGLVNPLLAGSGAIYGGTYTPVIAASTNVSAATGFATAYFRLGNKVLVVGFCTTTNTTASNTASTMFIPLPVPSIFAGAEDLAGGFIKSAAGASDASPGIITGELVNNRARVDFNAKTTAINNSTFWFMYTVK